MFQEKLLLKRPPFFQMVEMVCTGEEPPGACPQEGLIWEWFKGHLHTNPMHYLFIYCFIGVEWLPTTISTVIHIITYPTFRTPIQYQKNKHLFHSYKHQPYKIHLLSISNVTVYSKVHTWSHLFTKYTCEQLQFIYGHGQPQEPSPT